MWYVTRRHSHAEDPISNQVLYFFAISEAPGWLIFGLVWIGAEFVRYVDKLVLVDIRKPSYHFLENTPSKNEALSSFLQAAVTSLYHTAYLFVTKEYIASIWRIFRCLRRSPCLISLQWRSMGRTFGKKPRWSSNMLFRWCTWRGIGKSWPRQLHCIVLFACPVNIYVTHTRSSRECQHYFGQGG